MSFGRRRSRSFSWCQGTTMLITQPLSPFQWMFKEGEWWLVYDNGEEISLMYTKHERLPMKNFSTEVRASVDVNQFLAQAVLLLDVPNTSLKAIVDKMLEKALDGKESLPTIVEAKKALFADDSKTLLSRTIQGLVNGVNSDYDQSWLCAICNLVSLQKRYVAIARLKHPANMGETVQEIRFLILVLTPRKQKGTKNDLETGRTFATIFANRDLRQGLLGAQREYEFKRVLLQHAEDLAAQQSSSLTWLQEHGGEQDSDELKDLQTLPKQHKYVQRTFKKKYRFHIARGLWSDIKRRKAFYISDFVDGFVGHKTIHKTIATIFFLYFACILPTMAFGALYDSMTDGALDVRKAIIGQTIGGLVFALLGGQPLVIIMTTAPLSLYVKVIYSICQQFGLNFHAMYACVGLWNTFFLILFSIFDASRIMELSTRSTEEIFALFICIAFVVDPVKAAYENFQYNYMTPACSKEEYDASVTSNNTGFIFNFTNISSGKPYSNVASIGGSCHRETSLLFLILMFGTVWLAVSLYNFNKTPYLQASKREILADYALPVAVVLLSFIGSFVFKAVPTERFRYNPHFSFVLAPLQTLPWGAVLGAFGLGFALSLLFFIDQNISAAMVNNSSNKLKKGPAYHLDLLVVGLINGFLSLFGLPFMHGVLPHSPLHVRNLADIEERVDQGHVHDIILKVRETRVTALVAHIFIGLSLLLLPYPLAYIPTPVLNGLFLYMAITSLNGNQMFERIALLFTEQAAYPPTHYIRRCPQRKIHIFTVCQVIQLVIMCFFGFFPWPYVQMVFPVIIFLLIPLRCKVVPRLVDEKYLESLDQ